MSGYKHTWVKVYHGYGHKNNLTLYGHVYINRFIKERKYNTSIFQNIVHLLKLFFVEPVASAKLRLHWGSQSFETTTEEDGFYKFEWASDEEVPAGWHDVSVDLVDGSGQAVKTSQGKVFVPHVTQFGFISDIDDTIMVSHSSTVFRRLKVLLTNHPRSRTAFNDAVLHYQLLSLAHTTAGVPNPFFYVSSSEWNLYDDIKEFCRHNGLPEGAFLLSQLKRWFEFFKSGKTKHEAKLLRINRIVQAFPNQRFILIGDNSQSDPVIYKTISEKYPERIYAVYIRNVVQGNAARTASMLDDLKRKGIHTYQFDTSGHAIADCRQVGLIV